MITKLYQMMYVSGETAEPPVETTSIIEDIVRQQVVELVSKEYKIFTMQLIRSAFAVHELLTF